MITGEAKAEVFWLAFKGLPKKEQQLVVQKLLQDREFVEDLMDIALIEQRRSEPARPLEEYLAEQAKEGLQTPYRPISEKVGKRNWPTCLGRCIKGSSNGC